MDFNPSKIAFTIPFLDIDILWYGVLFATGFFLSLLVFRAMLLRNIIQRPRIDEFSIKRSMLIHILSKQGHVLYTLSQSNSIELLNGYITSAQHKLPLLTHRNHLLVQKSLKNGGDIQALANTLFVSSRVGHIKQISDQIRSSLDHLVVYVISGIVIGARLGHLLFYRPLSSWIMDPIQIMNIREGGLASHGAVVGLLVSLYLFARRYSFFTSSLGFLRLLDYMALASMPLAVCIRIGNFINQEIIGIPTTLPWSIRFLNPINQGLIVTRHPTQLYEAGTYAIVFLVGMWMIKRQHSLQRQGFIAGLTLVLAFGFRGLIEAFKEQQSYYFAQFNTHFTMGQVLCVPLILLGLYLIVQSRRFSNEKLDTLEKA